MGASGAGKSTLLDVLAGKKTGGRVTGAFAAATAMCVCLLYVAVL